MNLTYNGFDLHNLGEFAISSATEYEGGDAPQRAKVTLKVTIWLFEENFEANAALIRQAREALRTQNAVLRWTNPEANLHYVNQTVTLVRSDAPEEWGEFFQQLNLEFTYYEQDLLPQNLPLRVLRVGETKPLTLTHVSKFAEEATTERFHPLHPHRRTMQVKLTVSGQILGDPKQSLADRREALGDLAATFREQMNGAEAAVQFGHAGALVFDQVVRVTASTCELDQLVAALNYSFTATYTLFPDESDYALIEYTVEQKDGMTGEEHLTFTGRIQATTEALARAKLDVLSAAVLLQYGYENAQQLRFDTSATVVGSDEGGSVPAGRAAPTSLEVIPASRQVETGSFDIDETNPALPLVTVDISAFGLGTPPTGIAPRVVVPDNTADTFECVLIGGWMATSFQVRLTGVPAVSGYKIAYLLMP